MNWLIKSMNQARQWQVDIAKKLCEYRQSPMRRDRFNDDVWYLDSRGQGVLNMKKALSSPAGKELLRAERERSSIT